MSEGVTYVTAQTAATRSGEWLKKIEDRYMEDQAQGDEPDFQIEAALACGWALIAQVLR